MFSRWAAVDMIPGQTLRRFTYRQLVSKGDAIVFQHGNPTSCFLWRNVMPHCEGLGRLIACDLIGMGDSDKLPDSGPLRYSYAEQREYLFALWDQLALGDRPVLVLHDWGSALGFEWAFHNPHRVRGIVYMEAIVTPLRWSDWPEAARRIFHGFRSETGDELILTKNVFVERVLPGSILRKLTTNRPGNGGVPPSLPHCRRGPEAHLKLAPPDSPGRAPRGRNRGSSGLFRMVGAKSDSEVIHQC